MNLAHCLRYVGHGRRLQAGSGLGVLNLSLLSSGVASSGGVGAGTGPSVGGQRPRNNNFTIEGVDNNSKSVTGPLAYVPNDAVAEFSLLQNQVSPEFGHSSGGQFNTLIKSGTNSFHGAAYLYSQNRNFNAMDQATKNNGFKENQRFDDNRMGGQIGGPIFKNKLFFFGNLEYRPVGQASVPGAPICTPTAAGYATIKGIPNISSTNLGVFQTYATPAPVGGNCLSTSDKDPRTGLPNTNRDIYITNPSATGGFTPVQVGVLPTAAPNYTNNWALVDGMDYNIGKNDQLRGRYIYNRADGIDFAAALPAFFLTTPNRFHIVTINEYHAFRSNLNNELRLGFNRYANITPAGNFSFPGLDSFPDLIFDELGNLQLGPNPNAPQFGIQNTYQASENLIWSKSHHTFKFGIEGRKLIAPQSFTQRARGDYDYGTLDLFLRDFNPDQLAERSLGDPVYYGDQAALYWYANDNWRIRPNFTVNLGVRYEYTTIPTGERLQSLNSAASVPGLIDFSEPRAPKNNWGPRVGFAYSPGSSGHTSIRAGFGISYDVRYDNIGILSLPPQLSGTIDSVLFDPAIPSSQIPKYLGSGGIKPVAGGLQKFDPATPDCVDSGIPGGIPCQRFSTANHIVVDELDPKSMQWNLGIQHSFAKNYTIEVRYVGTRGIHLNTQERINRQPKVTPSFFLPTYLQKPTQAQLDALTVTLPQITKRSSFVPAYANAGFTGSNVVEFSPNGSSTYHGLATQLTRRFSNGLEFIGSYTYSHTIDNSTADFFTTLLTPRRPQDFQNLAADRSNSALDRRHRFTMALLYDVPFFKDKTWFVKNILGNWQLSNVYTFQSPEFLTVQAGRDSNLNGDSFSDRAILNPTGVPGTGTDVEALKNSAGAVVAYRALNPNAQYIRTGVGALANVGRNTLRSRHINNFDVGVAKRISFSERLKLEFNAGAFNVLNHPQFVPGSLNNINSIGYTSGGVRGFLTPGTKNFNNPEAVFASNARSLQLGFKVLF